VPGLAAPRSRRADASTPGTTRDLVVEVVGAQASTIAAPPNISLRVMISLKEPDLQLSNGSRARSGPAAGQTLERGGKGSRFTQQVLPQNSGRARLTAPVLECSF
jgi:hypothetical protein